jgi:hypothetical protein
VHAINRASGQAGTPDCKALRQIATLESLTLTDSSAVSAMAISEIGSLQELVLRKVNM